MRAEDKEQLLVYRSSWLGFSETFIASQLGALQRYSPSLFGLRIIPGIPLEGYPISVISSRKPHRLSELSFQYFGYAPQLYSAAERIGASLVHAHFALDGAECLPLAERLQLPLIVTLHGFDVTTDDDVFRQNWTGRRFLSRRKRLQQRASLFLCVSESIRKQALLRGFPHGKLRVHYNGVDTQRLGSRQSQTDGQTVLFIGRMVEKKGLSYLLRAMYLVQEHCPRARLVVIGDGPLRPRHEEQARDLGIRCEFLGAQPSEVVLNRLSQAHVLAVPSVQATTGDSEGLPTVVYEAYSLGIPVVGFASAGIPEAVLPGTGFLSPERDWEALAGQLTEVLQNRDLRNRLGAQARQLAVERFDLAKQIDKLEHIYDEVAAEHRYTWAKRERDLVPSIQ